MWCLSCSELHKCPSATGDMIVEGVGCAKWTEVDKAVVEAREELVMTLGPHSILSKPNPRKNKDEEEYTMSTNDEKRSKLRLLAIKSGLLQKIELAKSLRWTIEQLVERLEDKFPGCSTWSDEELDDAISNVGKAKKRQPAKSSKTAEVEEASSEETPKETKKRQPAKKRKRSTKKEDTPVVEKVEAKDLDSSDLTAEANTSKKRKPATRKKKRQPVVDGEPQAAVFQVDGKALIEEFGLADVKDQVVSNQTLLAGLTVEAEDTKASIAALTASVEDLSAVVSSIEKFCVWFYNSETEDDISKLTEVFK